jgi:hypothetical protein
MKSKFTFFLVLLAALSALSLSCKQRIDQYWIKWGEGNISYNSKANETSLRISFQLVNWHNTEARIVDWRFVIKSRKTPLLEINSSNYRTYAPFIEYSPVNRLTVSEFTIQSNNPRDYSDRHPYHGNLFPSYVPDNTDVFLTLTDSEGKTETTSQNLEIVFSCGFDDRPIGPSPNVDTLPSIP